MVKRAGEQTKWCQRWMGQAWWSEFGVGGSEDRSQVFPSRIVATCFKSACPHACMHIYVLSQSVSKTQVWNRDKQTQSKYSNQIGPRVSHDMLYDTTLYANKIILFNMIFIFWFHTYKISDACAISGMKETASHAKVEAFEDAGWMDCSICSYWRRCSVSPSMVFNFESWDAVWFFPLQRDTLDCWSIHGVLDKMLNLVKPSQQSNVELMLG